MLPPKLKLLLGIGSLLGLQILAEPAVPDAQDKALSPTVVALNATVKDGEIVGFEQFRRVFINVGDRRLMLVVPQGDFRADTSDPKKVVLVNHDYTCLLSFRITTSENAAAGPLNADLCRTWLTTMMGDQKILDEFSLQAAKCSGPAFDLISKVDGVSRTSRVAFIPSPVGILEFTISSSPEQFPAAKSVLQAWLRSLQISEPNGELKISRVVLGES